MRGVDCASRFVVASLAVSGRGQRGVRGQPRSSIQWWDVVLTSARTRTCEPKYARQTVAYGRDA